MTATVHVLHPAAAVPKLAGFGPGDRVVVDRLFHPHRGVTATVTRINWHHGRLDVPIDGITYAFYPEDLQHA